MPQDHPAGLPVFAADRTVPRETLSQNGPCVTDLGSWEREQQTEGFHVHEREPIGREKLNGITFTKRPPLFDHVPDDHRNRPGAERDCADSS